jgi:DNA-directed RNA polymerase specialized sigma subunit
LGGANVYGYGPNTTGWVDPYGLAKKKCPIDENEVAEELSRQLGRKPTKKELATEVGRRRQELETAPAPTRADLAAGQGLGTEHTRNASPSKKGKHQRGRRRKKKDKGGEKGDKRRAY